MYMVLYLMQASGEKVGGRGSGGMARAEDASNWVRLRITCFYSRLYQLAIGASSSGAIELISHYNHNINHIYVDIF